MHKPRFTGLSAGTVFCESDIVPYFQPVCNVSQNDCDGAEVLMRLWHPEKGLILPAGFLDAVNTSDGMLSVTTVLMQKVKAAIMARGYPFHNAFTLAFNIPAAVLSRPEFLCLCRDFLQDLRDYNISMMIELTERERLVVNADLLGSLQMLRAMSVSIALDDFGTGYSGLWLLKHLPVNNIKVPLEFTSGIITDHVSACITDATIQLAHWLGISVTVEGVESEKIMTSVKERGADFVQGYYYSRPLNASQFFLFCEKLTQRY